MHREKLINLPFCTQALIENSTVPTALNKGGHIFNERSLRSQVKTRVPPIGEREAVMKRTLQCYERNFKDCSQQTNKRRKLPHHANNNHVYNEQNKFHNYSRQQ
ncbi:uncharacterized protein LOC141873304 [Acropora palmata]|uniref:uncharacterized protein LOC141873304 n=1 Tax=Acropora palmata TaxID=6131 RepID=UPI003DA0C75B